jgi:hypothetical protein
MNDVNIGEKASEVMEFIMNSVCLDTGPDKFSKECMEILTLCISELIKASYCSCHYREGMQLAIDQIKSDFD